MKSHRPRKRFGQHFLRDPGVIDAILRAIAPAADDVVVEVGPGLAALTGLADLRRLMVKEIGRRRRRPGRFAGAGCGRGFHFDREVLARFAS